jgi:anaerobic magnesium-protoporphyrin IX monomethyl ester cyclase
MAKVLFVNPIIREDDKPKHIPYGLAQLVAIAIKGRHMVQVFDANAWRPSYEDTIEVLRADHWDVIAIGGLITTYGYIKKFVTLAREVCKDALIVAGGGFITPIPYEIMGFLKEIDVGVIGEAYVTLPELLNRIDKKDLDWRSLRGIIFRDKSGELILTEERPLYEDIDSLPFPAWDMFPLHIYFNNSGLLLSEEAMLAKRHLGVVASYGCPFRCKFCFHLGLSGELETVNVDGKRQIVISDRRHIRYHSPEYIIGLIKSVKDRFGVDFISFLDENFTYLAKKESWFDKFSQMWKEEGLQPKCIIMDTPHQPDACEGIHWGTTAHVALVKPEILRKFKELGCAHLDYGLESFSDEILRSIHKGANAQMNENAIKMTVQAGIRPIPNQMIGFPDESFESILTGVEAWQRLGIRSYPFFATPYPGSEWYFTYKDKILEQYNNNLEDFFLDLGDATKITAVISKTFNAVELLGLRELMLYRDVKKIKEYQKIRGDS